GRRLPLEWPPPAAAAAVAKRALGSPTVGGRWTYSQAHEINRLGPPPLLPSQCASRRPNVARHESRSDRTAGPRPTRERRRGARAVLLARAEAAASRLSSERAATVPKEHSSLPPDGSLTRILSVGCGSARLVRSDRRVSS